jgi:Domain of unknown function (DUF4192)
MIHALTAGDDSPRPTPGSRHDPEIPQPDRVRAGSPEELLAIVPHLLGFVPRASLVVIGTEAPNHLVKVTLRYDLPDPPGAGVAADIATHAVGVLKSQRLTALVAVGYGPSMLVDLVAGAVCAVAGSARVDVTDILRVEDGRYWSYVCGDEECCTAAGTPFDPGAHAAAAMVGAGKPVLADRSAVAARVAPLGGTAAESMRQATRRAERHVSQSLAKVRKSARLGAARRMIAAEGLNAVGGMIATYRTGTPRTTSSRGSRWRCATCGSGTTRGPGWTRRTWMRTGGCGST